MFITYGGDSTAASGENSLPTKKYWGRIEFAFNIPYFMLTYKIIDLDGGRLGKRFLFSEFEEVMKHHSAIKDSAESIEILLLSPGHMNGSTNYQIGNVHQVWKCHDDDEKFMFLLTDGAKQYSRLDLQELSTHKKGLVLSV